MDIGVSKASQGSGWIVRLDRRQISFRSEEEARAFVSTLQARLQAPHRLPAQRLAG